jgi:hypothetical protein
MNQEKTPSEVLDKEWASLYSALRVCLVDNVNFGIKLDSHD